MGKSGGRRKKGGGGNQGVAGDAPIPNANGTVELDSTIFLKRAHELKEEGNRRFQDKDYVGALEQYENAIKLTPKTHPDRAVFHSNKAACLMQMRPVDYESVISECSLALQVQPGFVRALLRRARALEAVGKYDTAMLDVQALLSSDPNHGDALDIARRLRMVLGPRQEAQQDPSSRPSPAALGASAIRGAPISGLGPCLPARPVPRKAAPTGSGPGSPVLANHKGDRPPSSIAASEKALELKPQMPKVALKLPNGPSKSDEKDGQQGGHSSGSSAPLPDDRSTSEGVTKWRPLKLVYDHDIRLAEMPSNCSFKVLREIVSKRLPSSKSVLIKYKDGDGDLVTITCTSELRMAEGHVDALPPRDADPKKAGSAAMLRLHIVDVGPEQEPAVVEEEEKPIESGESKGGETGPPLSLGDSGLDSVETERGKSGSSAEGSGKEKVEASEEVEIDDWVFEFAQLFRNHVGIDPDAHMDLHEMGMELCSEALEQTVASEEAQLLFDKAALKFREVAALAFFNWGNVHMCAARKRIPLDDSAPAQLEVAYGWADGKYSLAREKYEEALVIKPDFYEALLALGQQQFERAKLQWTYALAKKVDVTSWDATETMKLLDSAEEKMKAATEMWEKLEEERAKEVKDPGAVKIEGLMKRRKKQGEGESSCGMMGEPTPEELAEQAGLMRSQIHLFWGNMLFERSQMEFKLGRDGDGWKEHLDAAIERFKLAGASEADISSVLKNHCSNAGAEEGRRKES